MKAKINSETGKVEWIGRGSGEDWVDLPNDLPSQPDGTSSLYYDDVDESFYYE